MNRPRAATTRQRFQASGATALALAIAGLLAGCGGSGSATTASGSHSSAPRSQSSSASGTATPAPVESNPPGDIPDTVAYVSYTDQASGVRFTHPEGWSQSSVAGGVKFSDKLNSVTVTASSGPAPTVGSVRQSASSTLPGPNAAFELKDVSAASLPAGQAVKVVWRSNSAPDPVTGKVYRDEVVTYLLAAPGGKFVRMDLSGPVGADNVDPYRTMSQSLKLG